MKKSVAKVIRDGQCCNFALGFLHEWQAKRGYVDLMEVVKLKPALAKRIDKTIKDFFAAQAKRDRK